jgi:hypothetical protein
MLTREAPFRRSSWNPETRTFDLVLSVGAPVERYDLNGPFDEVLDLRGASMPALVPLLDTHNRFNLDGKLGEVTNIRLESGQLVGTATLSRHAPLAQRIAGELSDGVKYGVSIGYQVQDWNERTDPTTKRREKLATSFDVLEASLVAIPADPAATTRSFDPMPTEVKTPTTTPPADSTVTVATRAETNIEIRNIATLSGLDQRWIDSQIDAGVTTDQARAAAFEAMQARSAVTATISNARVEIVADHTDPVSIRSAMAGALAHRLAPGVVKLEGPATQYRGHRVLDMIGALATARGERIDLRDQGALLERAIGAHSTSDFPLLLADSTNKALLAQYEVAAPTYRQWAARRPFNDFRDHTFLRVGDFPSFKPVNEAGEFEYGTISESAEKVRAKEYGTGISVGRQLLINDDLSALSDFSSMIATRAAADENSMAYSVLSTNGAMSDGKALFHADHGNKAASGTTIDATNVSAAVLALRGQKSLDDLPLNLQPAFLVVGPAKEVAARQLLASINPTKSSDVNPWSNFAKLIVDANITGAAWYLFADPGAAPTVVYGYVAGSEGPQVRTEICFDTRAVKVAAGLDFAVGAIDYRGAYFNAGA